jgi:FAD/FMN-containing dehydrogenase
MPLTRIYLKNDNDFQQHIEKNIPTLFVSSQTSTVIPFEQLNKIIDCKDDFYIAHCSPKPQMELLENGNFKVNSSVTWQDAEIFLKSKGLNVFVSPTEELACICAGIATSATGERSFGYGPIRNHIDQLTFIDFKGKSHTLSSSRRLNDHRIFQGKNKSILANYQKSSSKYNLFKNAPFPRLEKETDLLTGTEGQLGVITEAIIKTNKNDTVTILGIKLPLWENNYTQHIQIVELIQPFKSSVISCEFVDSHSCSYLKNNKWKNCDIIFIEIINNKFDYIYNHFLSKKLSNIHEDNIFELSQNEYHQLRMEIPRSISENNLKKNVIKKGTDIQVALSHFSKLLDKYRTFTKLGIKYNLFGHIGDCHLHFNFMPSKEQEICCLKELAQLYKEIVQWGDSPFAEHGIGLLKKAFIKDYLTQDQFDMYKNLKKEMDPHNIFFPQGYLNLYQS